VITVAALWRHPIKSHGREALETVTLVAGQTMPWDRHWAVTHDSTKFDADSPAWVMCRNFMIGTVTPGLAGVWAALDVENHTITLRHVELGTITFDPDAPADAQRFIAWIAPLSSDTVQPTGIVSVPGRGMTDSAFPSVSLMNMATHRAVETQVGQEIAPERWRGNIWVDGLAAWAENDWIGRDVRVGDAILQVSERIGRCRHTSANPVTGARDVDTLSALRDGWDHQDFGVYATVVKGGKITRNDTVEVV